MIKMTNGEIILVGIKLKRRIGLACFLFIMCASNTINSQSYDNKIWEITGMQNSGINGKWLHPFGDRILEITDTQIIEHFFNGRKTISKNYRTRNGEIYYFDTAFTFKIIQDDIMLLDFKDPKNRTFFKDTSGNKPSFYTGFYHRINNTGVIALHKGRYAYTYSFGKWAYRNDASQAPSYWLRAHTDINSLDSLDFIDNKKVLIKRITFVEEDRGKNPWGGFVSYTKAEECEYEIIGSDLIIKTDENTLKLKIVNQRTIFNNLERSVFIYNLNERGYIE